MRDKTSPLIISVDLKLLGSTPYPLGAPSPILNQLDSSIDSLQIDFYKSCDVCQPNLAIDGMLYTNILCTYSIDGMLYTSILCTYSIDGLLYTNILCTYSIDGMLYTNILYTYSIDGLLYTSILYLYIFYRWFVIY